MNGISRRAFINQSAMGFLAAGSLLGRTNGFAETGGRRKPNILFIMTDQQHAGMMSCAGNKWLETPALDGLAREGVRFTKAYSPNPYCVPSRTSMATGVMSCRIGADNNALGMKIKSLPPEVNANSMGKVMKRAGYDTFYGGKVHMCKSLTPRNSGYDEYFKDERNKLPAACLKFIKRKRDKPFFVVASFINPHDICFAHFGRQGKDRHGVLKLYKKAASLPLEELPPLPDNYAIPENEPAAIEAALSFQKYTPTKAMRKEYGDKDWRINRWIYNRLTEKVDKNIGTLLAGLKAAGLEENTVIIFTSDHGNMAGNHRLTSKCIPYEESVGVPLILKYKGNIPSNKTDSTHLISIGLDILPTLCDYAGVKKPEHLLGVSLRPLAEGKRVESWRSYVASENDWFRMIRSRKYKYCAFSIADRKELLVDMENDPGEMRNLADDPKFKKVLIEHRKLLADWSKLSGDKDASKYVRAVRRSPNLRRRS
ncbi:MAG: sulfatase-like hydrolase/transferase [Phycisphaerales bacterium]|jgi:arylsulfatase A-like enzyme|nr:sulfatase-like hydrolase/transferase [Phycisphaerales bacterium]